MTGSWIVVVSLMGEAALGEPNVAIARVADIIPGPEGAFPCLLTPFQDSLYFRAKAEPHGSRSALWRWDGAEPERVALIGEFPTDLLPAADGLWFFADNKLWRFDGTETTLAPGWTVKLTVPEELIAYGGDLWFRASSFSSPNIGTELWKYDRTNVSYFDIYPGMNPFGAKNSYPQHFIEFGGLLYFNACGPTTGGTELFRTNGTDYEVAANIANGSSPEQFCIFRGELYFSAYRSDLGRELWRFDGSRAELATDAVPGPGSLNPYDLCVYGDALYFGAEGGIEGCELWRFDGETAELVADINQNPYIPDIDPVHHSWPAGLTVHEGVLYFTADDGVHGRELWSFDGTAATLVADIHPGKDGSYPAGLRSWNGALWFAADDGVAGSELWQLTARPAMAFLRGDANGDGVRDISDPIATLKCLFGIDAVSPLPCEKSADANDSGDLDISDAIFTLLVLYADLPAPELIGECCADDTPDGLTCERYTSCP